MQVAPPAPPPRPDCTCAALALSSPRTPNRTHKQLHRRAHEPPPVRALMLGGGGGGGGDAQSCQFCGFCIYLSELSTQPAAATRDRSCPPLMHVSPLSVARFSGSARVPRAWHAGLAHPHGTPVSVGYYRRALPASAQRNPKRTWSETGHAPPPYLLAHGLGALPSLPSFFRGVVLGSRLREKQRCSLPPLLFFDAGRRAALAPRRILGTAACAAP